MTDTTTQALREMVSDQFERVHALVQRVTKGLSAAAATWRPDADANPVAWLVWHLTRIQDDHVADLAGREQVWTAEGWQKRFALPFDRWATGYGQSREEVAAVRVVAADLAAYHADVHRMSVDYAATLTAAELARVVDTAWDPPVTASVRLVSLLGDCLQHAGQAAYVRGLAERAGIG